MTVGDPNSILFVLYKKKVHTLGIAIISILFWWLSSMYANFPYNVGVNFDCY